MLINTDMLVRQHMAYLRTLDDAAAELNQFETLYDHMFFYFTEKLEMSHDEARKVVNDFISDFSKA